MLALCVIGTWLSSGPNFIMPFFLNWFCTSRTTSCILSMFLSPICVSWPFYVLSGCKLTSRPRIEPNEFKWPKVCWLSDGTLIMLPANRTPFDYTNSSWFSGFRETFAKLSKNARNEVSFATYSAVIWLKNKSLSFLLNYSHISNFSNTWVISGSFFTTSMCCLASARASAVALKVGLLGFTWNANSLRAWIAVCFRICFGLLPWRKLLYLSKGCNKSKDFYGTFSSVLR